MDGNIKPGKGVDISQNGFSKFKIFDYKKSLNDYVDNIQKYSSKGISVDEFLSKNNIKVVNANNKLAASELFGDSKLYLIETANNVLNNGNLTDIQKIELSSLLAKYEKMSVGNLNVEDMLNDLQKYLGEEEIQKAFNIYQYGKADQLANNYSSEQLASIFNYTNCGGFEINAWLNDTNLIGSKSIKKARETYGSVNQIQNLISGQKGNKVFTSSQGDILHNIDSVIASANYDEAIVTYRGVRDLFDGQDMIDCNNLKIGDSFRSAGYQSSSVVFDKCYGAKKNDTNIILKIIVPPNSGTAAYIENITGVKRYGQMEMLIKRDATMTVVGDLEYKNINGIMKTIVPVIVQ